MAHNVVDASLRVHFFVYRYLLHGGVCIHDFNSIPLIAMNGKYWFERQLIRWQHEIEFPSKNKCVDAYWVSTVHTLTQNTVCGVGFSAVVTFALDMASKTKSKKRKEKIEYSLSLFALLARVFILHLFFIQYSEQRENENSRNLNIYWIYMHTVKASSKSGEKGIRLREMCENVLASFTLQSKKYESKIVQEIWENGHESESETKQGRESGREIERERDPTICNFKIQSRHRHIKIIFIFHLSLRPSLPHSLKRFGFNLQSYWQHTDIIH